MNQKPFWQSVSFWMVILSIIGVVLDKLVAGGVLPNEGWVAIISSVIGLLVKRGMVDSATIKANALVEASKQNPQPPSVP